MKKEDELIIVVILEVITFMTIVSLFHSTFLNITFLIIIIIFGILGCYWQKNRKLRGLEQRNKLMANSKVIVATLAYDKVWISTSRSRYYLNLECVYFDKEMEKTYLFKGKKCFMGPDSEYGFKYKSLASPNGLEIFLKPQGNINNKINVIVQEDDYSNYTIDFTSFLDDLLEIV